MISGMEEIKAKDVVVVTTLQDPVFSVRSGFIHMNYLPEKVTSHCDAHDVNSRVAED